MAKPKPLIKVNRPPDMSRLVLDMPGDLHRTIKAACALRGIAMTTEIQRILRIAFEKETARNPAGG